MKYQICLLLIIGLTLIGNCSGQQALCDDPTYDKQWVSHDTDCTMWYWCEDLVAYEGQCEDGLGFNSITQKCTYKANSDCAEDPATTTTAEPPLEDCGETDFFFVRTEGSCAQYRICAVGVFHDYECVTGLLFDESSSMCNFETDVDCTDEAQPVQECPEVDDPDVVIKLPDLDDPLCNAYFICRDGAKISQNCLPGLLFNPDKSDCDLPDNVQCDGTRHFKMPPKHVTKKSKQILRK